MADIMADIISKVLEGLANPAIVAVIAALILIILYIKLQEEFIARQ